jgi:phenylpropionate dioxygenase-like ring-hydroxylating dioxygenase large terminal subunit
MPVKVGVWNRFVFVNLSGDAGDLLAWLEDVPTLLAAYGFSEQTMGPKSDFVLALNWKTVVDNNLDGYHIPMTHHDTIHRKMKTNGIDMSQGGLTTSVGWYPMREGTLGSMPAPLEHCPEYMRTRSVLVAVYPTLVLSADPSGSFLISRVSPIDVGKTEVSVWAYGSFSETGGDDDEEANRQASEEGARIVQEDYAVCRRVEQGLRSRFHRDGPVHMLELQSQGLHRWIAHTLSKPSIP